MPTAVRALLILVAGLVTGPAAASPPIRVTGTLEVLQIDDFAGGGSRLVPRLADEATGEVLELDLPAADAGRGLRTGMRIAVRGTILAGVVRGHSRVLAADADGGSVEVLAAPAAAAVTGQRRAVVLVIDFLHDGKTVACTDGAIAQRMFTGSPSVDLLYQESSFGQLAWPADTDGNGAADVFRVAIDDAGNDCAYDTWRTKADAAATDLGVDLGLYQHRVYVLPSSVGCGWAGLAVVGCAGSCWALVATCDRGDVYAHEVGHNLGMHHASFDADNDGAVDPTCPWGAWPGGGEYCDDSDFMGISTNVWRQVNAPHKEQMGWLPGDTVVDVTAGGTWAVAPLEVDPGASGLPHVLRVQKTAGTAYYVSYRRRLGYDADLRAAYADRTSVHVHGGAGNTLLVRLLADGETFADASNGLTVTQLAHDAASATIRITRSCGNGVLDAGEECDGASLGGATCGGCAGTPACTTGCRLDYGPCTDGICDPGETCASCAADCVATGAVCGDNVCQAGDGESCVTCPADCAGRQGGKPQSRYCCGAGGQNPVGCDPGLCGACTTQPVAVCCGDAVCSGDESSASCNRDCGACTAELCTGGADEDCDGLADCADGDCAVDPACQTSCTDGDADGWCVEDGDCNDADPAAHPGAAEVCSGGGDEDCDGPANCADPDCAAAPGCTTCGAPGAACTQNADCCSGSCTGKPRRKTCK